MTVIFPVEPSSEECYRLRSMRFDGMIDSKPGFEAQLQRMRLEAVQGVSAPSISASSMISIAEFVTTPIWLLKKIPSNETSISQPIDSCTIYLSRKSRGSSALLSPQSCNAYEAHVVVSISTAVIPSFSGGRTPSCADLGHSNCRRRLGVNRMRRKLISYSHTPTCGLGGRHHPFSASTILSTRVSTLPFRIAT